MGRLARVVALRSLAARGRATVPECPTPSIRLAVSSCASRDAVALADDAAFSPRARVGVAIAMRRHCSGTALAAPNSTLGPVSHARRHPSGWPGDEPFAVLR